MDLTARAKRELSVQPQLHSQAKSRYHDRPIRYLSSAALAVHLAVEQHSIGKTDMKSFCQFLSLVFVLVGLLISCSEPPDARMAELQRYYALKGDGINPPVKRVALKTTGRAGTIPDQKTAPVLGTTNAPAAPSSTNVPPLSSTNVPALSTPSAPILSTTNAPPTLPPSTNTPTVP